MMENNYFGGNDRYSSMLNESYSAGRAASENARRQSIAKAQSIANDSLRQEYITKEQAKKALPQQAALLGVGGISETAALALESAYGNNRNSIYKSQQNAVSEINMQADKEQADELASYQNALMQWEQQRAATQREQQRYDNELAFKKEQFSYQKEQDSYKREIDAYERRQKELLAAQKATRSSVSSKSSASTKSAKKSSSKESDKYLYLYPENGSLRQLF